MKPAENKVHVAPYKSQMKPAENRGLGYVAPYRSQMKAAENKVHVAPYRSQMKPPNQGSVASYRKKEEPESEPYASGSGSNAHWQEDSTSYYSQYDPFC